MVMYDSVLCNYIAVMDAPALFGSFVQASSLSKTVVPALLSAIHEASEKTCQRGAPFFSFFATLHFLDPCGTALLLNQMNLSS